MTEYAGTNADMDGDGAATAFVRHTVLPYTPSSRLRMPAMEEP